MDAETAAWMGFSVFPGIGPVRFNLLRTYFGSAKAAWNAPLSVLEKINLPEKLSREFIDFRNKFDASSYARELEKLHVAVLKIDSPKYPKLLKEIPDAPFLLYVLGKN